MKNTLLTLCLLLSIGLNAKGLNKHSPDVSDPIYICKLSGVPSNCNMMDVNAGEKIDGQLLKIYLAIHKKFGADNVVLLFNRHYAIPSEIQFSTYTGDGCPFGIISYCQDFYWVRSDIFGQWTASIK